MVALQDFYDARKLIEKGLDESLPRLEVETRIPVIINGEVLDASFPTLNHP